MGGIALTRSSILKKNIDILGGLDIFGQPEFDSFGPEWGRHGSPRAHTQSERSHGLQEGFWMPPGPLGYHII